MRKVSGYALAFTAILSFSAAVPASLLAQEVEIEVAGPWSFVTDPTPGTTGRIVVIAPKSTDHELDIFSGGDAQNVSGATQPKYGFYKLDVPNFDPARCPTPQPPPAPYSVAVPATAVQAALSGTGNRYAISLPKPCSYESYVETRAKIDANQIGPITAEKSYPTWMVLHYSLSSAPASTLLQGNADDGTSYGSNTLVFSPSSMHPPSTATPAISIVLYNNSLGEDRLCDQHSADLFDVVVKDFWGQNNTHRLFPELYDTGAIPREQTHRYNYNQCVQVFSGLAMERVLLPVNRIIAAISSLREELARSEFKKAKNQFQTTKELLVSYWNSRVPKTIQEDLDSTDKTINRAIESRKCTIADAEATLSLTLYLLSPGRTDCHTPQLDINHTVR